VRPFSWLSRSWRPVKRDSSPSKFLSRHYDRLSTSRTIRRPPQSCPHSPAQCRRATAKNADWKGKCYQDVSTTRMTTYLLRGAAAMDRAFRNFRNGDAHFGPHPWPAPYIPNWAPIFYLNTTRQPPRMRPEKASAMPASDRWVSTRAETTSRFRGRQDSGRIEIVNYTLTAASQSLSATWIATCGAVQASWFVV
jgi:hypothetical protein